MRALSFVTRGALLIMVLASAVPPARAAVGAFGLGSPSNGGYVGGTPTLKWGTSSGATSYTLTITPSGGAAPLVHAGLTATSYTATAGELTEPGAPYTWRVTARDAGGTTADSSTTWSFFVDTTPPSAFGLSAPAADAILRAQAAAFSWSAASDTASGVAKYHVYIDGALCGDATAAGFSFRSDTCNPGNGKHAWAVSAEDLAGNVRWCNEAPGGQGGRSFTIDNAGPTAGNSSLTVDLSSWNADANMLDTGVNVSPGDTLTVTATGTWCSLSCTLGCYDIQGTSNPTGGGVPAPNCDIAALIARIGSTYYCVGHGTTITAGSFVGGNLELGINSRNGGCRDKTVTATITGGRAFNLVAPADGAVLNEQMPTFSWQPAMDPVAGGVRYWLFIDGSTVGPFAYLTDTSYALTSRLADGTHTWSVRAFDAAGNATTSAPRSFRVDTTRPQAFRLTMPTNGACAMSPTPSLCWEAGATDATGIGTRQLWVDGALAFSTTAATSCATPNAALAPGRHSWYASLIDVAGNVRRSTNTFEIVIDYVAPGAPTPTVPASGAALVDPPRFSWTAATDAVGVAKYEIYVDDALAATVDGKTTSWLAATDLAAGAHTWYVRALDACNQAASSPIVPFSLGACAPDGAAHPCPGYEVGRCKPGTRTCTAAGVFSACSGAVKPSLELCNGEDDDCDGLVDDGTNACGGVCALPTSPWTPCDGNDGDLCQEGVYLCNGLNAVACVEVTPNNAEVCNGRDDDCNGMVDDQCTNAPPMPDGGAPDGGPGTGGAGGAKGGTGGGTDAGSGGNAGIGGGRGGTATAGQSGTGGTSNQGGAGAPDASTGAGGTGGGAGGERDANADAGSTGGTRADAATGGQRPDAATVDARGPTSSDGCSCEVQGTAPFGAPWATLALGALLLRRGRRQRRRW